MGVVPALPSAFCLQPREDPLVERAKRNGRLDAFLIQNLATDAGTGGFGNHTGATRLAGSGDLRSHASYVPNLSALSQSASPAGLSKLIVMAGMNGRVQAYILVSARGMELAAGIPAENVRAQ